MTPKCLSGNHGNYFICTTVKSSIAFCFLEFETLLNERKEEWVWPPTVNTHRSVQIHTHMKLPTIFRHGVGQYCSQAHKKSTYQENALSNTPEEVRQ